jgi:hypothetical protein
MIIKNRLRVFVLMVALLLAGLSLITTERSVNAGFWADSYKIQVAFYDPILVPHYGAYFAGALGSQQYFDGPSGQPSGYSSWDWWGQDLAVLLLEKSWLFTHSDAWTPSNHHAFMAYR